MMPEEELKLPENEKALEFIDMVAFALGAKETMTGLHFGVPDYMGERICYVRDCVRVIRKWLEKENTND